MIVAVNTTVCLCMYALAVAQADCLTRDKVVLMVLFTYNLALILLGMKL